MATGSSYSPLRQAASQGRWQTRPQTLGKGMASRMRARASANLPWAMRAT